MKKPVKLKTIKLQSPRCVWAVSVGGGGRACEGERGGIMSIAKWKVVVGES